VEVSEAVVAPLTVGIEESGRTRVKDRYVSSRRPRAASSARRGSRRRFSGRRAPRGGRASESFRRGAWALLPSFPTQLTHFDPRLSERGVAHGLPRPQLSTTFLNAGA
jgi:hypothetical protein